MTEDLVVELPAGGSLRLQHPDEVELFTQLGTRYIEDYQIEKSNDLAQLGAILVQHLTLFRAQQAISGMEPDFDEDGLPTGQYKRVDLSATDREKALAMLNTATKEIRNAEKSLGIDKASREAGRGGIEDWLRTLRSAAKDYGVHIAERVKAYEQFAMDLRWRVRLNENGDDEDRAYHECTDEGIIRWAREELAKLEEVDKEFAKQKGKLWVGKQ